MIYGDDMSKPVNDIAEAENAAIKRTRNERRFAILVAIPSGLRGGNPRLVNHWPKVSKNH